MSLFTFTEEDKKKQNAAGLQKQEGPHPKGEFDGVIKKAKIKSHATKGEYVLLVVETKYGAAFSSLYFNDKTVAFKGEQGPMTFADLAKKELRKIIMSGYKRGAELPTKINSLVDVAMELTGLPVRIKVTHKEYNGKTYANTRFGKVNEIDRIEKKPKMKNEAATLVRLTEEADDDEIGF